MIGNAVGDRHQKPNIDLSKLNIMLLLAVEDRATASLMQQMLEQSNRQYQIIGLPKLTTIVEAVQQQNFDLVLVQTKQIEKVSHISQSISTPIIMLIDPEEELKAIAALGAGVQDYICKNQINVDRLDQAICASIERQKLVNQQNQQLNKLKQYKNLVESQTELVCRFLADGSLVFVNQVYANCWQQSPSAMIGRSWFEPIAAEDLELAILTLVQLNHTSPSHSAHVPMQAQTQVVCRVNTPSGQIWLDWHISLVGNRSKIVYQAVGKKITPPKPTEKLNPTQQLRLKLEEQEFRRMADQLPVLVWTTDQQDQINWVNQTWLDFSGRSLSDELGNNWLSLVDPDEREMCWYAFTSAIQKHKRLQLEHRMRGHDGEYRWFLNTGTPRFDAEHQLIGYIGTCVDITREKTAEASLAQQARWERLTTKITQHLHLSLDTKKILAIAAQDIHDYLNIDQLLITAINRNTLRVHKDNNNHNSSQTKELIEQLQPWIANSANLAGGKPEIIDHLQSIRVDNPYLKQQQQAGVQALLLLPITIEQQLWGVIYARHSSNARPWNRREIRWLGQIARELAIAIEKAEMHQQLVAAKQELEVIATVDRLTGIANRRQFDTYLNQEWQRLAREKRYLSLIMIDIDYFKPYNDVYGHPAGDGCLQKVARAIASCAKRPADLPARYGGEEFAVILPSTNQRGAIYVAQEIRRRVEKLTIEHCDSEVSSSVTCSLGVASCIPQPHLSTDLLLVAADQALYNAKAQGRNCVAWNHTQLLD